jgi:hypothetical protein
MRHRLSLATALATGLLSLTLTIGSVSAANQTFVVGMTGPQEVCNPPTACNDPDAAGLASLRLNPSSGTVCFKLSWEGIDGTVTAAHIHEAAPGFAGPVVIGFFMGESFAGTDRDSGCVKADRELVNEILLEPAAYYVNVHSTRYPQGAIRGQLA